MDNFSKLSAKVALVLATSFLCSACAHQDDSVGELTVADTKSETSRADEPNPQPKAKELTEQQLNQYTRRTFEPHEALPGIDEFSVHDTIVHLVKQGRPRLDLGSMRYYNEKITRNDLLVLQKDGGGQLSELILESLSLNDADIEPIATLKLDSLNLKRNPVRDLHALRNLQSLTRLYLNFTSVDAAGWQIVANLKNLGELDAIGTQISDTDLPAFYSLKKLRLIDLTDCKNVSQAGISRLKQALPNCVVCTTSKLQAVPEIGQSDLKMVRRSLMYHKDFEEADLTIQKFIASWEKHKNGRPAWFAEAYRLRGECQKSLGNLAAAKKLFLKCLEISMKELPDDIMVPVAQADYALVLEKEKNWKGALEWRRKADDFVSKHSFAGKDKLKTAENWNKMASDYEKLGDEKMARHLVENAIALTEGVGYDNLHELHRYKNHLRNLKAHKESAESDPE